MTRFAAPLMLLVLAACATTESGVQSYQLPPGRMDYDAMARAKADCAAVGGTVHRKGAPGEDPARMNNYICDIPRKAAQP